MSRPFPKWPSGAWKVICDVCGVVYPSTDVRRRWDGLMVCPSDYEDRHPQDFIRAIPDNPSVPWTRPEGEDGFVHVCWEEDRNGLADYGTADCAIVGYATAGPQWCTSDGKQAVPGYGVAGCMVSGWWKYSLQAEPQVLYYAYDFSPPTIETSHLLQEDYFHILTEDGYYIGI